MRRFHRIHGRTHARTHERTDAHTHAHTHRTHAYLRTTCPRSCGMHVLCVQFTRYDMLFALLFQLYLDLPSPKCRPRRQGNPFLMSPYTGLLLRVALFNLTTMQRRNVTFQNQTWKLGHYYCLSLWSLL